MGQSAGQLVYVVGPSGAGKDSILSWLEAHGAGALRMVRARRTITRPNVPGAEAHEAVTAEQFEQLVSSGVLAMHWVANGCSYGVRASELAALASGAVVCVNGSRAYLPQAQTLFPGMAVLAISAPETRVAPALAGTWARDGCRGGRAPGAQRQFAGVAAPTLGGGVQQRLTGRRRPGCAGGAASVDARRLA
jgi:phosphonate metabolism protein PhnN/1,5-bisphosphokinase (PRPP-forming)